MYPDTALDTMNQDLLDWFRANGGSTGSLAVRRSAGMRGLHLKDGAAFGSEVLYVPQQLAITADVARCSSIGQQIAAGRGDVSERGYIAAFVLNARRRGGFWKPYIDILKNGIFRHPLFSFADNKASLHKWFYTSSCMVALHDECEREFPSIAESLRAADRFTIQDFSG